MKKWLLQLFNGVLLAAVLLIALELFWLSSSVEQRQFIAQRLSLPLDPQQTPLLPQWLLPALPPTEHTASSQANTAEPVMSIQERVSQVVRRAAPVTDVCIKPPSQPLAETEKPAVYRWTDEHGKVHFGDQPKRAGDAQDLSDRYQQQGKGVRVTFEFPGWRGDAELTHQLRKQAELLHRVLIRFIEPAYWRQINLNLVVFHSQAAFDQYRDQQGHNDGWAAYYDGRENRAFLARQSGEHGLQHTLQVARHEMTHAMMMGMLGSTPIWLSEGVAQYLERLQWQLSSARIEPPLAELQQLQASGQDDFAQLLDVTHEDFNAEQQNENYQQSAAMTFFLFDHDEGKRWITHTLTSFARQPCRPLPAEQAFSAYPGGLAAVRQAYRQWLQAGRFNSHYY
ncbi:hypothetical protein CHH28_09900 [Bacterioplanes sanyensis]|uniref:DUF4124 domain-containing protein n=1 Tax=Bacterioplanes sanyensis TaxID=1249553 RepID=A0A222FL79_9GAMM|nr:DUF4124 domain-containing protein [Bacterioplanes sanyensis]ASP38973.1 hypothetical protein CHH28_09900 [Bacterioplanes sanyensis]